MAIHIGFLRAGWKGLIIGGLCFIVPAMLIVFLLAWVYVRFGAKPQAKWLLYGIKPVVISIIIQALLDLGRKAVKGPLTATAALIVLVLYFIGANEIALLFTGGLAVMLVMNFQRLRKRTLGIFLVPLGGVGVLSQVSTHFTLPLLFLIFLKIGDVLYGSGYVLLAFLRADFVVRFGWLTDRQLYWASNTRPFIYNGHIYWLYPRRFTGGASINSRYLSAFVCFRCYFQSIDSKDMQLDMVQRFVGRRQRRFT